MTSPNLSIDNKCHYHLEIAVGHSDAPLVSTLYSDPFLLLEGFTAVCMGMEANDWQDLMDDDIRMGAISKLIEYVDIGEQIGIFATVGKFTVRVFNCSGSCGMAPLN